MGQKTKIPYLSCKIVHHCNRSCENCDSFSPWLHPWKIDIQELTNDLKILSQELEVRTFFVTGGEPLLHPQIVEVLGCVRESGIAWNVDVLTNGDFLHHAPKRFWASVNTVYVTVYPDSRHKWNLKDLQVEADRYGSRIRLVPRENFEHILLNQENENFDLVSQIWRTCRLRNFCTEMRSGRIFQCAPHSFFDHRMRALGVETEVALQDSIAFRENGNWNRELIGVMNQDAPLAACHWCLGSVGKREPVKQLQATTRNQGLQMSHGKIEEVLDSSRMAKIIQEMEARLNCEK